MAVAPHVTPVSEHFLADAELIAMDAVAEAAAVLNGQSAALLAAAASGNAPEIEARLWLCRRALLAAISSWREVTPAHSPNANAEGAR